MAPPKSVGTNQCDHLLVIEALRGGGGRVEWVSRHAKEPGEGSMSNSEDQLYSCNPPLERMDIPQVDSSSYTLFVFIESSRFERLRVQDSKPMFTQCDRRHCKNGWGAPREALGPGDRITPLTHHATEDLADMGRSQGGIRQAAIGGAGGAADLVGAAGAPGDNGAFSNREWDGVERRNMMVHAVSGCSNRPHCPNDPHTNVAHGSRYPRPQVENCQSPTANLQLPTDLPLPPPTPPPPASRDPRD